MFERSISSSVGGGAWGFILFTTAPVCLVFSPEGAQYDSPGRSPGSRTKLMFEPYGLKHGRNSCTQGVALGYRIAPLRAEDECRLPEPFRPLGEQLGLGNEHFVLVGRQRQILDDPHALGEIIGPAISA